MDFTYSMQVPFGNFSGVKLTQTNQLDVVIFFKNQNARVKCLFSHPIVFIINPLSYIALYFVILVCLMRTILLIKGRALALSGLVIEWQHSPPPPLDK